MCNIKSKKKLPIIHKLTFNTKHKNSFKTKFLVEQQTRKTRFKQWVNSYTSKIITSITFIKIKLQTSSYVTIKIHQLNVQFII